ncbi:unnamed protein product [Rotaria magnacalcarata]|uniref:Fibrinogen C-terminal domain-containing protein n=2 Tax=Rotaria magnacalcarata TaxID=392030 RepID=A0A816UTX0_9BILA|nr:unnamed protein product [Rotaria magnacalcarata]
MLTKQLNSTELKQNCTSHMLPTTTTTMNNSNVPLVKFRRYAPKISDNAIERCYFVLIHFFFYGIMLLIVYVRLEEFSSRQEAIITAINANHNFNSHHKLHDQFNNKKFSSTNCSCHIFLHPTQDPTTQCLELHFGLNETISNVFCPILRNDQEYYEWVVIQNRRTNSISFNRSWIEYRRGFGNSLNQTDFWIGNENLHWLTNNYQCRLKIELTDWYNETRIATYELFRISNQRDEYRLQIGEYNGTMEPYNKADSFSRWHHNFPFSTYDHYAIENINCSNLHGGVGWWFHSGTECAHVQLNGRLPTHTDGLVPLNTGILWIGWRTDRHYSFQHVRMLIQPKFKRHRRRRR